MNIKKREVKIAMYLRDKVQQYVDGTMKLNDFAAEVHTEACKIAD